MQATKPKSKNQTNSNIRMNEEDVVPSYWLSKELQLNLKQKF